MANNNPPSRMLTRDEAGRWVKMLADDTYTDEAVEKAEQFLVMYSTQHDKTSTQICREIGVSEGTVYNILLSENPVYNPLAQAYQRARKRRAIRGADQVIDIADDDSGDITTLPDGRGAINNAKVQRDKARIETRLRLAAAYDPATYAPASAKLDININVEITDRINKALERVGSVIDAEPVDKSVDK